MINTANEVNQLKKLIDETTQIIFYQLEMDQLDNVLHAIDKRETYLNDLIGLLAKDKYLSLLPYFSHLQECNQQLIEKMRQEKDNIQEVILNMNQAENYQT